MIEHKVYLPHANLQEYIAKYGIIEVKAGMEESYFSPPLAFSGFIIQIINSEKIVIAKINERDFFISNYIVTGQVTQPVYGKLVGHVKSLMVFFNPLGMYQLFGNDMSLLTNHSLNLEDFLGKVCAKNLIKDLKSINDNEHQVKVLNDFFLQSSPIKKDLTCIKSALNYIHNKNGATSISEILDYCSCQRKTLERQFKKMIGISPKVYSHIYQFKCLFIFLRENPSITWSQLSQKFGYFDQSHMSRYVKEYLNVSPNNIVKLDMDLISYLLSR